MITTDYSEKLYHGKLEILEKKNNSLDIYDLSKLIQTNQ